MSDQPDLDRETILDEPGESGGGLAADRRDVVRALRAHGLSGPAAAAVWTVARRVVRDTRRRGREHSVMLDAETGVQAGPILSGEAHQTDILSQITARHPGRHYGHVHTHPSSGSFSGGDARVLLTNPELRVLIVVGIDGRWYIMSRAIGTVVADQWVAHDRFVAEYRRGLDDATTPLVEIAHVVWTMISEELGLRYDRIEGTAS